jgi:methylaspartate mutase sigma subunit
MWNLHVVQEELEARGFEVLNFGPCTPTKLLAETVRDRRPQLVVISTINGHGEQSAIKIIETLKLYQAHRIGPIVIGGKLSTLPINEDRLYNSLIDCGFTGVFVSERPWAEFDTFLQHVR